MITALCLLAFILTIWRMFLEHKHISDELFDKHVEEFLGKTIKLSSCEEQGFAAKAFALFVIATYMKRR